MTPVDIAQAVTTGAALIIALIALARSRPCTRGYIGPQGEPGPPGPVGATGPQGDPGYNPFTEDEMTWVRRAAAEAQDAPTPEPINLASLRTGASLACPLDGCHWHVHGVDTAEARSRYEEHYDEEHRS